MKKFLLFFSAIMSATILFAAPENPCPTVSEVQIIPISNNGTSVTRQISLRLTNDVSINPKGVKVEVLCDGVNVVRTDCFLASNAAGGAIYTTGQFTCPVSSSPVIRITRYTASNGSCQGGTCGEILNIPVVRVSGGINCTTPRTFNLAIECSLTTNGSPTAISGTYEAFVDDNRNGQVDPAEEANLKIKSSTAFSTSTSGATAPFTSVFNATNIPYGVAVNADQMTDPVLIRLNVPAINIAGNLTAIANTCSTLPVLMKEFNAALQKEKVGLNWITGSESNNSGFEIQRRVDNGKYVAIGFVNSKLAGGNGAGAAYSFEDAALPVSGVVYYRLRQVDFDGASIYSDIKAIRRSGRSIQVSVYPNPNRGTANVVIPEGSGLLDASLEDFAGKRIQQWNALSTKNLQLSNLKPGIYVLRLNFRNSGEQVVERIMVQ